MDYTDLIAWWRASDVELLPPATEAEVREVFRALGHPVSRDVIDLFTQVGGFEDYTCDILWSFWSLARIGKRNNAGGPFCWFADYLISSYAYGFKYEKEENSAVYLDWGSEEHPPERLADSVPEFFEKYRRRACDVYADCPNGCPRCDETA